MWQVFELVAHSETSKFRSKLCSVSTRINEIMLGVSAARSRVFTKYSRCTYCTRANRPPRLGTVTHPYIDAYQHMVSYPHACKRWCNISRKEKALIATDYHLIVRLKNPDLLAARFVFGITLYKTLANHERLDSAHKWLIDAVIKSQQTLRATEHCQDVVALHEIFHKYKLVRADNYACWVGDVSRVRRTLYAANCKKYGWYIDMQIFARMALAKQRDELLELIIASSCKLDTFTNDISPRAHECLRRYGVEITEGLGGMGYIVKFGGGFDY